MRVHTGTHKRNSQRVRWVCVRGQDVADADAESDAGGESGVWMPACADAPAGIVEPGGHGGIVVATTGSIDLRKSSEWIRWGICQLGGVAEQKGWANVGPLARLQSVTG